MNLTTTFVKQALESISYIDLQDWASEAFGQSMLSKRKGDRLSEIEIGLQNSR